jgi:hypothetical protein
MNFMGAMLVSLWVFGWMLAMVRAALKARDAVLAIPSVASGRENYSGGTTS